MPANSRRPQIRVTAAEKAALKRRPHHASVRAHRLVGLRLADLLERLRAGGDRFVLAEINDLLSALSPSEFTTAVSDLHVDGLSPLLQNYIAAMVEHAAYLKGEAPPPWTCDIRPLGRPHFAVPFRRLQPYLLRSAPVAFRRRNIFIDATVGDRV